MKEDSKSKNSLEIIVHPSDSLDVDSKLKELQSNIFHGLTEEEAQKRLTEYGYNGNALIGYYEENKAESALDALKSTLALQSRVRRDSTVHEVNARVLVPGDIILLRIGDIIPADSVMLAIDVTVEEESEVDIEAIEISVDQSALTGESLPVVKKRGDILYSSSIVKQGTTFALVTVTGQHTFVGRAAKLLGVKGRDVISSKHWWSRLFGKKSDEGHFQRIVNQLGNFLIVITVILVLIIFFVTVFIKKVAVLLALRQALILAIAAIPIGLPTVLSVTMAVGARQLAKVKVIVKRLTAIEELSSVSILCVDKTGTLTMNKLSLDKPYLAKKIKGCGGEYGRVVGNVLEDVIEEDRFSEQDLLLYAFLASEPNTQDPIEIAVQHAAKSKVPLLSDPTPQLDEKEREKPNVPVMSSSGTLPEVEPTTKQTTGVYSRYKVLKFTPFNPTSKRTEAVIEDSSTGTKFKVTKGAPQVILRLLHTTESQTVSKAESMVKQFAGSGLRALGVAKTDINNQTINDQQDEWQLIGLISLLDPPRPDSAKILNECKKFGLSVKMITGDQLIIAKEVAKRLGMPRTILDAYVSLDNQEIPEERLKEMVFKADGFAHVVPEHKHKVVSLLQEQGYLVAMTGDGVNDAPALKKANVGIAVEGATDAARSAADIVLLSSGLGTIIDGIKTSRAIFKRMRSYSLYRIASTIHFLIFFFVTLIAFDFSLPDIMIILIAVLNDIATLVISTDNALISQQPDKWRVGQLLFSSTILGILLAGISFGHYFIALNVFGVTREHLQSIMYLQISSCPHFVIFSTRVPYSYFWRDVPSLLFVVAIVGTQVVALLIAVLGAEAFGASSIGWVWGIVILAISTGSFMVLDLVKVFLVKIWSFKTTAILWPSPKRRKELKHRKLVLKQKQEAERLRRRARVVLLAIIFLNSFKRNRRHGQIQTSI
ncbi:hypothetical protein HK098_004118 [Nowakowskiella sp. JEL0407]|nr:hypothetical protein HK098_004118 [Nowakowskiella sp. JEL0407]